MTLNHPNRRRHSQASTHSQSGFTMMELIIVFAIIAVLATIMASTGLLSARLRGRDTQRKSDLGQIARSLEAYINDYGTYPASNAGDIVGCGAGPSACTWGSEFRDAQGTLYMSRLPQDRSTPNSVYYYQASSDGSSWQLFARLENDADDVLDLDNDGDYDTDDENLLPAYADCGTDPCNYGISSSNTTLTTTLP